MNCIRFFILTGLIITLAYSCKKEEKKNTLPQFAVTGDQFIDKMTIEITKDPLNPDLRYSRALKLYDKGMLDECIEDMRVAISTDSLKPEYYHLVADAFMDNNLSSRAIASMEKVAALFPTRIPSLLKLAEFQTILQQYDAAITTCNSILKVDPQNAEAYFVIGTTLAQQGQTQRAINAFQTATELDAKLIDAWISLGNLYSESKNTKAIDIYKNAIGLDPKNSNAKHALAYHYQNNGQVDQALSLYNEIIIQDPAYTDAYLNAGILLLERRELDKAYDMFNIMVGVAPKQWEGYHYRGIVNFENKKYKEAKLDFRSSTNLNPENKKGLELIEECDKYLK